MDLLVIPLFLCLRLPHLTEAPCRSPHQKVNNYDYPDILLKINNDYSLGFFSATDAYMKCDPSSFGLTELVEDKR